MTGPTTQRPPPICSFPNQIPRSFCCPITFEVMVDPVWTSDGHAYERAAIEQWLASSSTSPQTGSQLVDKRVTTAWAIKKAIEEWTHATGAAAAPGKTAPGKTAADPANTAAAETAAKATPKAEAAPWLSLSMVSLLVVMFAATVKIGDVPQVFPVSKSRTQSHASSPSSPPSPPP